MYSCPRCGYCSNIRGNLKNHLNRKKICKPLLKNIDIEELKKNFSNNVNVCVNMSDSDVNLNVNPVNLNVNTPPKNVNTPVNPVNLNVNTPVNTPSENVNMAINLQKNLLESSGMLLPNELETINSVSDTKSEDSQEGGYICIYCKKKYQYRQSKYRHQKKCKGNIKTEELTILSSEKEISTTSLEKMQKERIEQLEQQVLNLVEKNCELTSQGTVNNTINNTHIENQQINIQINGFGSEVTDYISPEYIQDLFNGPYGAVPKLLEQIHFHPDHPENWNVKITNDKKSHAQIYDRKRDKWIKRDKKETIVDMVEKGYNMLDDHFSKADKKKILDNKVVSKFKTFQEKYDNSDKELHRNLNKSTLLLILNESM